MEEFPFCETGVAPGSALARAWSRMRFLNMTLPNASIVIESDATFYELRSQEGPDSQDLENASQMPPIEAL